MSNPIITATTEMVKLASVDLNLELCKYLSKRCYKFIQEFPTEVNIDLQDATILYQLLLHSRDQAVGSSFKCQMDVRLVTFLMELLQNADHENEEDWESDYREAVFKTFQDAGFSILDRYSIKMVNTTIN